MKIIKISISFLLLMLSVMNPMSGQKGEYCIYKTSKEYNENRPSCGLHSDSAKDAIRFYSMFPRSYIDVVKAGKKQRYFKDSIYAYRDTDNKVYRFYKSKYREYEILDNKGLVIYVAVLPVLSTTGKNVQFVTHYYFSKDLNADLIPLTVLNLKRAFPKNVKFHTLLDLNFSGGTPVSEFDNESNMFKVNELLNKSASWIP